MPELPEVETVARGLAATLTGARIDALTHLRAGIFHPGNELSRAQWPTRLAGCQFVNFRRRAKWLIAELLAPPSAIIAVAATTATPQRLWWIVHLRMTGRVLVVDADTPRPKHTHLELRVTGGPGGSGDASGKTQFPARLVRFVDPRRFGRILLVTRDPFSAEGAAVLGDLGPEPLTVTAAEFIDRARARKTTRMKPLLLDQSFLAGLGNIYVDESLFVAGLSPTARVNQIPAARLTDLHAAIQAVLTKAIRLGGTSMRDYIHPDGSYGAYHEQFLAYGRGGEPCPVCQTPLTEIRLIQRATVFCKHCQPTTPKRSKPSRGLALHVLG